VKRTGLIMPIMSPAWAFKERYNDFPE